MLVPLPAMCVISRCPEARPVPLLPMLMNEHWMFLVPLVFAARNSLDQPETHLFLSSLWIWVLCFLSVSYLADNVFVSQEIAAQ